MKNLNKKTKSKYVKFRVSAAELERLTIDAVNSKLSLSELIRNKIGLPSKRESLLLIFHISRIGNNINQLAKTMNTVHKNGKLDNYQINTALTRLLAIQAELENIRIDFKNEELEKNKHLYG